MKEVLEHTWAIGPSIATAFAGGSGEALRPCTVGAQGSGGTPSVVATRGRVILNMREKKFCRRSCCLRMRLNDRAHLIHPGVNGLKTSPGESAGAPSTRASEYPICFCVGTKRTSLGSNGRPRSKNVSPAFVSLVSAGLRWRSSTSCRFAGGGCLWFVVAHSGNAAGQQSLGGAAELPWKKGTRLPHAHHHTA